MSRQLRDTSRGKLARIERFARDVRRVEVDFSEVRNPRESRPQECEVTVHLTRRLVVARAAATEPGAALDLVIDKIEQQVARIKDKRVTRVHVRRGASANGHMPGAISERVR